MLNMYDTQVYNAMLRETAAFHVYVVHTADGPIGTIGRVPIESPNPELPERFRRVDGEFATYTDPAEALIAGWRLAARVGIALTVMPSAEPYVDAAAELAAERGIDPAELDASLRNS